MIQHTIDMMAEAAMNPLASTAPKNLKDHFEKFCLPSNLWECVHQYRVDRFDAAMRKHGLVIKDLWLTVLHDEIPFLSFENIFDPFAYYADSGPFNSAPGSHVVLPPVPAKLYYGLATDSTPLVERDIYRLTDRMKKVPTKKVLGLAWAVAAFYLDDEPGFGNSREEAVAYIAINDIQNSFQKHAMKREIWSSRTRGVTLPNMVETRKADFRELFAKVGKPIDEMEFKCMPTSDIIDYATDQRAVLLGHNRHIVFCSHCSGRLLDMMNKHMMRKRPSKFVM